MGSTELTGTTPRNQLPETEMKQQFSLAFVQMVVSAAGCSIKEHKTDYDGIDITIVSSVDYIEVFGPQIELQVKCTAQERLRTETTMRWTLEADRFTKLTNPKTFLPRFIGVLLVPAEPSSWLSQDEEQLITKSCMYWACYLTQIRAIAACQGCFAHKSE
jgi:hypothetical protein